MPKFGLDLKDVERDERKLLKRLGENADTLSNILEDVDKTLDKVKYENTVYNMAFMNALNFIQSHALDAVVVAAKLGCIGSKEFNYFPYIEHLTSAIKNNTEGLVEIIPLVEKKDVEIKLNLNILGNINMWADAVQTVRNNLQELGLSKRAYVSEPAAASRMWREKIYRTGREGGKVSRTRKKKDGKEEKIDVTSQYKDRYKNTVLARLGEIPRGKAPYWYLIEHGNVNITMSPNRGGVAYPTFEGTHFTEVARNKLEGLWEEAFEQYKKKAEEFLADAIAKEYGFEGGAKSFNELEEDIVRQVFEGVDRDIVSAAKAGQEVGNIIRINDVAVKGWVTSKQNAALRGRNKLGQFTIIPR